MIDKKTIEQNIRAQAMDEVSSLIIDSASSRIKLTEERVRIMLLSMILTHGEDAVADMYAWYFWATDQNYEMSRIMESIWHDLNGREDKFMQPRTQGYLKDYLDTIHE